MSRVTPLADWVLVRELEEEDKGACLPVEGDDAPPKEPGIRRCVVEAVGPGEKDTHGRPQPLDVVKGSLVLVLAATLCIQDNRPGARFLVKACQIIATI